MGLPLNINYLISCCNLYYYQRLREIGDKELNIYLLKVEVYNQLFQQRLSTTKIIQISSSSALNQVHICQSLFNILHYINVYHASNSTSRSWITHIKLCQFARFAHHGDPPSQEIPKSDCFYVIFSSGIQDKLCQRCQSQLDNETKLKMIEK